MTLIWILVALAMVQPILASKVMAAARQRMLAKLEAERKSRVIVLVHRQETMSLLGFPLMRYIDIDDSEAILRAIQLTDDDVPIDLVLHTPGGLVLASFQIARALHDHPAKVTVFVPHLAMSGGTLIALAADEVVMSSHAVLGPVDPQLAGLPAASILRAVELKGVERVEDETLILADQARMALAQIRAGVVHLLEDDRPREQAEELADALSDGRFTHDQGLSPEAARELGVPVTVEMPTLVLQLMGLFPQPMRRSRAVEFSPERRSAH